jgi:uncharacterized protein YecA (UPF0149 family)
MITEDVSHKEIYERLCKVEAKVDKVAEDTQGMVTAFNAASGAFTVLEWIAKVAKPVLWIIATVAAFVTIVHNTKP